MPRNLKVGEDIDWNLAPEDATHCLYGVWRKIVKEEAFYWADKGGRWDKHPQGKALLGFRALIAKHLPIVVINGIEIDWNKAPAGTTHAMHEAAAIRNNGQWRRLADGRVHDWKGGQWKVRGLAEAERWLNANKGLYAEYPNLKQQIAAPAYKPIPEPRKPVGWWR